MLQQILETKLEIMHSKGVASMPSGVTNIAEHLARPMTIESLWPLLTQGIAEFFGGLQVYSLTSEEWGAVKRLSEDTNQTWEWTFGRSPEFVLRQKIKYDANDVEAEIFVKNGLIKDVKPLGANATLLPGVIVGANALVGAGSVVVRDVPEGKVVVGNPARVIRDINDLAAYQVERLVNGQSLVP